ARKDIALSEKAFECLSRAVPNGLTTDDLASLPSSKTLKSAPKYQQIAKEASRNRRSKRSEVTVARLMSPPIDNRDYLNHLIASVSNQEMSLAGLSNGVIQPGSSD